MIAPSALRVKQAQRALHPFRCASLSAPLASGPKLVSFLARAVHLELPLISWKSKRQRKPVNLVAKERSQRKGRVHALLALQVIGANLSERPSFQLVRSALLEHLAVAKSVRPRAVAKPAVLVLSAPATTSASNARQEGTAARLVLQHASSAL